MTSVILAGICIWIIFLGGANKLENSFLGYLGFGKDGEHAIIIKALAILTLTYTIFEFIL